MSAALYLCLHLPDFAAQAVECAQPELRRRPVAILSGAPPLEYVFVVNQQARELGVERGMGRMQAESFAGVVVFRRERAQENRCFAHLVECAGHFSPRVEVIAAPADDHSSEATLVLDIANSERLLGTPEQIAKAIERKVHAIGLEASIAISSNACAAVLAARGTRGITILPLGREAQSLAPLPVSVLQLEEEHAATLAAWGIRTLGQLAALPSRSLAARLGQSGLRLQRQARGEYDHLLVPMEAPPDAPLTAAMQLEHPVELLEPLLFLLNQLLQQLLEEAQQRALAIASLELTVFFASDSEDRRTIRPALPERDRLVLLKLIQLELELRPPAAAVAGLRIVAHPARPQTAQQGLFTAQAPEPGRMAMLLARLRKLVGEGRAGSPELLDSRAPEAFRMAGFAPSHENHLGSSKQSMVPHICPSLADVGGSPALRMFRPPRVVAIELCRGAPVAMLYDGQRCKVRASSGPWRTSGEWWTHPGWCREEWEVVVHDDGIASEKLQNETLRLAHDPANGGWYVIGIYD
jgi:protein ImuB